MDLVPEICGSLMANQRESMMGCLMSVYGEGMGINLRDQSAAQVRQKLTCYVEQVIRVFGLFGNAVKVQEMSQNNDLTVELCQALSCKSKFDMGHEM